MSIRRESARVNKGIPPTRFTPHFMGVSHSPKRLEMEGTQSTGGTNTENSNGTLSEEQLQPHDDLPGFSGGYASAQSNRGVLIPDQLENNSGVTAAVTNMYQQFNTQLQQVMAAVQSLTKELVEVKNAQNQNVNVEPRLIDLNVATAAAAREVRVQTPVGARPMVNNPPLAYTTSQRINPGAGVMGGAHALPLQFSESMEYESASQGHGSTSVASRYVKTIDLPKFSGDPMEWPIFERSYLDSTAEFGYTNTRNLMRLQRALTGKAKSTVESLLPYPESVPEIMAALRQSFGRPEQIVNRRISEVRKMPNIQTGNYAALIEFANVVRNLAGFMRHANSNHRLCDATLLMELVAKLPVDIQMQWAEFKENLSTFGSISDLSNFLNNISRRANDIQDSLPSSSAASRGPTYTNTRQPQKRHAFVAIGKQHSCAICSKSCSKITECEEFRKLTLPARWERVKLKRLCFCCLKPGHAVNKCYSQKKCVINECGKLHHPMLHKTGEPQAAESNKVYSAEAYMDRSDVLFQILPVVIKVGEKAVKTYAFIDHGASHSMIEWNLADKLGLEGVNSRLSMQWLANVSSDQPTRRVDFSIQGYGASRKAYRMSGVYTVRNLNLPKQSSNVKGILYQDAKPELIIGLDHAYLTTAISKPNIGAMNQPIIAVTRLGIVAYGNCSASYAANHDNAEKVFVAFSMKKKLLDLERMMADYYASDSLIVAQPKVKMLSEDEKTAMNMMTVNTKYIEGKYEVGLLWAKNDVMFPESQDMALQRLKGVQAKMKKNPEFASQYAEKIENLIVKGYARKLSPDEAAVKHDKTFYLPHFAVHNPNKKSIRVVFDAAAEINGLSLNKMLLAGPDLNQPLLSIMFKFRQAPIAICGDIKEMFLQVAVRKEDQDAQRFVWSPMDNPAAVDTYVMTRMLFGAKCSPTLAQYVKNSNAEKYKDSCARAVDGIINKHYVDDYVDCFSDEAEAITVVKDVIRIHQQGGFEIRNFVSNSSQLLKEIGSEQPSSEVVAIDESDVERILGMYWNHKSDTFCFLLKFHKVNADVLQLKRKPTKREILSVVMSVFDPFGLLANYVIVGKLLMQELWKFGAQWDETIPDRLMPKWEAWIQNITNVNQVTVPRCYHNNFLQSKNVELHVFADASEEAMAAVAYFRIEYENNIITKFVTAKTRCAPLKYVSIPRLELQAAVLAVRIKELIVSNHDISIKAFYYWSDSSTVISWVRSDSRRYKQYVANRVGEILEGTKVNEWRWLPTALNIADAATRSKQECFKLNEQWLQGPEFLKKAKEHWPMLQSTTGAINDSNELKTKYYAMTVLNKAQLFELVDIQRYSKYQKLVRVVAWVLRFVAKCRRVEGTYRSYLTSDEITKSELELCREVQKIEFFKERKKLKAGLPIDKNSCLLQLNPYIDAEGIIRLCGRIDRSMFLKDHEKRQIILPKNNVFTNLLITHYHERNYHINRSAVIADIQRKFWIPSIRANLKKREAQCNVCKIRNTKPKPPIMGLLPNDRIEPYVRPFSYTGLDYFGPIMISIGRRKEKKWVALFTCLTVRAIHLELAADLSSDACLLCIRNFINRRGVPVQIRSDNGTNFVGIPKELKNEANFMDEKVIGEKVSNLGIKWVFNCPANPSEGGAWERMVQSVKRALFMILNETAPKIETLISALIEAENIVNSRPLTYLPLDHNDDEPLTPNHFLLNTVNSTQTPGDDATKLLCTRKQWRIAQTLKNAFWKRWMYEYLPDLTRRTKWCLPQEPLKTNDLVLICDAALPRSSWKKGLIVSLNQGADGTSRSAEVKTSAGILRRPVSKLAKLDVTALK